MFDTNKDNTGEFELLLKAKGNRSDIDSNITNDKNEIQKADKSASIIDLFDMVNKLVTLTLTDLNIEFIPDEQINNLILPDKKIEKNYITFKVVERESKDELKPRIREIIEQKKEVRSGIIYGQKFKSLIQFNFIAPDYREANTIMDRFEDMMTVYTGFIKKNGIAEMYFNKQFEDRDYDILRQIVSVKNIRYYVETEKLIVIFKEKIREIETMLISQKGGKING